MELVYLWVEEYKNIKNQGFNFSPRFRCEFNEEKNELTINENKDYLSIFPNNINITAIVGENGSGKSSLYELLFNLIHNVKIKETNKNNFIIIYEEKDDKYFSNKTIINFDKSIENLSSRDNNDYFLLLDFVFTPWNIKNEKNYKNNYALEPSSILFNKNFLNKIEIARFDSNIKNFGFYGYMFLKNIHIKNDFFKKLKQLINVEIQERGDGTIPKLEEFMTFIFLNQGIVNEIKEHFQIEIDIDVKKIVTIYNSYENDILDFFNNRNNDESVNYLKECVKKFKEKIVSIKNDDEITKIYKNFKNLYLLFSLYNFDMNFKDGFNFKDLSSGQTNLLAYIGYVAKYIKRCKDSNKKSLTIIIDECETSLHPNWQKETLKFFLDSVRDLVSQNFMINFIFISHSPFIISDIPKENVIFLEEGRQVYPFEDGKQTFGANIHTLLSHGFFMKDGLMGEFAKEKINDVINFLNGNKSLITTNDNAQNLINIIGEPIIKKQLQKMLDSKRLRKIDEIDLIKNQMELLSKRLEEIENAKD